MFERKSEIVRIPIFTPVEGKVYFQTIVSPDDTYTNYKVMGTYASLETARMFYGRDMRRHSKENGGTSHYAIRRVED